MQSKIYILIITLLIFSCAKEKDPLIQTFDTIYAQVLSNDFTNFDSYLDDKSLALVEKLNDPLYLNIDSIISLGDQYKIKYTLVDYFSLSENRIKEEGSQVELYRYLGANDISFFSFRNAYYIDKSKLKKGKENFVSIIKEEMTQSKRTWVNFDGNQSKGYKLNLIYTLQLAEPKTKSQFKSYHKASNQEMSFQKYLRHYYWQNSGQNSQRFETDMRELEKNMREGRKQLINNYAERGLVDKMNGS